jgi:hypothetical protein
MVRSSVHREIGGYRDKEFRNTSDLDMYLRISKRYQVAILDEFLISYRWGHGNSAQKYRHLRTDASRFFTIMDLYIAEDGPTVATPESLSAYESHRCEDNLMRTVNHYILDQRPQALGVLKQIRFKNLIATRRIMRWRLSMLFVLLNVLVRLPRIAAIGNVFYRRWHAGIRMKKAFGWNKLVVNPKRTFQPGQQGLQN